MDGYVVSNHDDRVCSPKDRVVMFPFQIGLNYEMAYIMGVTF